MLTIFLLDFIDKNSYLKGRNKTSTKILWPVVYITWRQSRGKNVPVIKPRTIFSNFMVPWQINLLEKTTINKLNLKSGIFEITKSKLTSNLAWFSNWLGWKRHGTLQVHQQNLFSTQKFISRGDLSFVWLFFLSILSK